MSNDIITTCHNGSFVSPGSIYRGKTAGKELKIEAKAEMVPSHAKTKLVETKSDGSTIFRKAGEIAKTSAELIKEGKPPKEKPPSEKPKTEEGEGKKK